MEYADPCPEADWPWTIFNAKEGFVIDRAVTQKAAYEGYGPESDFPDTVVILRTA